ncbi:NACHT domain-containing protein [Streptomyces sp. NPDC056061]|uniref:NACHT domain-containing protein n=1 Tax=Streptomyces sp. NPDC056061 TaxID=3345700 RepID=UPI0035D89231
MIRLPRHERRQWVRLGLLVLCALVCLGLVWALLDSEEKFEGEQLVGWAGLFVSLAALMVSLAQFFPPLSPPTDAARFADDLAVSVRAQWEEEVNARNLRAPRVIPLSWAATRRPVAASPEETHGGTVDARVLRLSLNGRLEGDFDQAARRLAQGYRQVPSGRLVVLGEPGSGKTVLAAVLTLGLLAEREPGAPVPVLLTLSGWDPVSESLRDWIERTVGTAYYGGRTDVPRLLLRGQRLLLILDGLDEMPEASRRNAVRAINESSGEGAGVVLTCRSAEYQDVIEGGSPVLRRAPVVEVAPVSAADAVAYLNDVTWPAGVAWEPVYANLRADPDSPMAVALSTPLTLTLTRTVYSSCDRDPRELLGFDSSHAVEDHLLDHVITAAYAPEPGSAGQRSPDAWHRDAKQAETYLTYLATYLHRNRERDLVWWLMSRRLSSRLTGFALGIAVGLLVTFTMIGGMSLTDTKFDDDDAFSIPMVIGLGCAVLTMIVWYAAPGETPGRLSFRRHGSLGRLGQGLATGVKLSATLIVPVGAAGAVTLVFLGNWTEPDLAAYVMLVAAVCGVALAISLALAVHAWLDAPSERSRMASPPVLLRQDRTSSLTGALAAGALLGACAAPLLILGFSSAFVVFSALTYGPAAPSATGFIAARFDSNAAYGSITAGVMSSLLPAAVFALLVLLARAWPRFLLLRLVLAIQGKLPWKLMRFLSDARDRNLLRQSAGAYQFRHIRLQERLASRALAQDRTLPTRVPTGRRRTIRAATTAAAATLLVAGALAVSDTSPDRSAPDFMDTGDVEYMSFGPPGEDVLITVDNAGEVRQWSTKTGKEYVDRKNFVTNGGSRISLDSDPEFSDETFMAREDGLMAFGVDYSDPDMEPEVIAEARFFPWRGEKWDKVSLAPTPRSSLPEYVSSGGRHYLYVDNGSKLSLIRFDTVTKKVDRCRMKSDGADNSMWHISDDGQRLAAAPMAEASAVVEIFDLCKRVDKLIFGYGSINSVALNSDGSVLAVNADGVTRLRPLDR